MKEGRKANELDKWIMPKGFGKGGVELPIEINKAKHATQAIKIWIEKHEKPNTCS